MTRSQVIGLAVIILAICALVGVGNGPWVVVAVLLLGVDKLV